jgi:hypothetical protein
MGLKHGGHMQKVAHDLIARGLSQDEVDKIMYQNALRVFAQVTAQPKAVEKIASLAWPVRAGVGQ